MKTLGFIFIAIGLALLIFVVYSAIQKNNRMLSPVPDQEGVKVIYITPSE